jgi:uncharacterized protein DUF1207
MRWSRIAVLAFGVVPAATAVADEEPPRSEEGWQFLPDTRIFSPLLADPRWPHFSVGYARMIRQGFPQIRNSGTISLGEHVGMVEFASDDGARVGVGLQPAVFGLFNLDELSKDLVNADYRLGIPVDFRYGALSLEAVVLHQSSHLGDEFVLRVQHQRMNLSYEAATLNVSLEIGSLRFYGGFGHLIHSVPPDLDPWSARQGLEWSSTEGESFGPVVAVHVEERQESSWRPDLSVRAGVEFVDPRRSRRRFQILLEYYRGQDPNGQFFRQRIDSVGIGIHFYF